MTSSEIRNREPILHNQEPADSGKQQTETLRTKMLEDLKDKLARFFYLPCAQCYSELHVPGLGIFSGCHRVMNRDRGMNMPRHLNLGLCGACMYF
jgi:hypothetical protein